MTDNLPATISDEMLALMSEASRTDVETFTMRQLIVPWLGIVQAGTGYGKRSHDDYIEGCVEGDLIDNLMLKPMKSALVVPCKYEDHWSEWTHEEDERGQRKQGKLIKQWFNDSSKYDQSTGGDPGFPRRTIEGNDINQTPTYYCLLIDQERWMGRPVVLGLRSTQAKKARRWNSLIDINSFNGPQGAFTAPFYAQSFKLTTTPEKSRSSPDPYMGWVITPDRMTLILPNGRAIWDHAQAVRKAVEAGEMRSAPPVRDVSDDAPRREQAAPARGGNEPPPRSDADDIPF
jgi:hypothetical protein